MNKIDHTKLRSWNWTQRRLGVTLIVGAVLLFASFLLTRTATGDTNTGDAGKPSSALYASGIAETYDFKFGPNPFAPSNATSVTGTFIPGESFVASTRCGTCHTDAHAQWRQSAHGNAFREPFYQKNVKDLQSQKGIEFTRHCESCHNPAALFSGALTKSISRRARHSTYLASPGARSRR